MKALNLTLLGTALLLSTGILIKSIGKKAQIGYAVSKNSNGYQQTFAVAAYGGVGAWAGAEFGATLGSFGGPVGTVIGGAFGAL